MVHFYCAARRRRVVQQYYACINGCSWQLVCVIWHVRMMFLWRVLVDGGLSSS